MSPRGESEIVLASGPGIDQVQGLWREYWSSLGMPADFQNFGDEVKTLPGVYAPPAGRLLLALIHGEPAGTAALRPLGRDACEAKRLYVRPAFRGMSIGRSLLDRLIAEARAAGYRAMYGDTLKSMSRAIEMYRQAGFMEVEPYSSSPTPEAIYLRLDLID